MGRIAETFRKLKSHGRAALIPFITAGDPSPNHTVALIRALVKGGADVVELGVPFSDPMADGPTIQRSSERALRAGTGLGDVLDAVHRYRLEDDGTPIVLMGYANPVERMGLRDFAERAAASGVDGVLIVDYPPEESGPWLQALAGTGLDPIFLLSPTSSDARIERVAQVASGYIYYVSLKGVTGAAHIDTADVSRMLARIRTRTSIPIGVGFGIREPQTARDLAGVADAVVIGSRIVEEIERAAPDDAASRAGCLLAEFREAIDASAKGKV